MESRRDISTTAAGSSIGWQNFLNTNLINEVLAFQVDEMSSFLVVGQVCTNSVDHDHHQRAVIHVHPIGATDEFVRGIADERAVDLNAKIRFVKSRHGLFPVAAQFGSTSVKLRQVRYDLIASNRNRPHSG